MKKNLAVIVVILATCASAATVRMWVYGQAGIATEADKQSASSEASDQATQNAQGACTGTVINTAITATNCARLGSDDSAQWVCAVSAKALCEIQTGR